MENRTKGMTLCLLGGITFLANGDNLAAAALLSDIAKDLGLSISTAAFSVTSYMMAFGLFTLLFGPLADRYGKAKVVNMAAIGTAVFSMLGALAYDLPSLVFLRAMNGLFGAGIIPVSIALVGEMYNDSERQKAIGKVLGIAFLGGAMATAIGGAIAYFGSWRLVYFAYGVAEFILAMVMLKVLKKDKSVTRQLNIWGSYKLALSNKRFLRKVSVIFFIGFAILGSFTFSGVSIMERTGLNVFNVGLVLSLYGVGTVLGGRIAPYLRKILKNGFLVSAGFLGFIALSILAYTNVLGWQAVGLLGFGITFIFLQSTLLATLQEELRQMKGTVMSLASFNLFLGAAMGTQVNGYLMERYGASSVFSLASYIVMGVGIGAAILVASYETRKKAALKNL
ncbi:MFS transporter [Saccharicrinis fermentans]|uniref:Sulfonamide resistance protein n=1 Tax=Saccharicrinis fermentans DSM 9555 = JCM 21142 TaxID=869213 RepID=W7YDN6_9BACT|nr:MFS transporter [Saccharicrinis fermentans]GAF05583.1 sulfonamide resistance protein [Saccharicrinis fermentans DSM 9555 = JCM 21142]